MGKITVASFEGDKVKIIHAARKRKGVVIERTEVVNEHEFDSYLKGEKTKEFIVTREFTECDHEILHTPVLKSKYLDKYIEAEIRKITGKTDFTFVYSVVGEQLINKRKMLEVYYYAVSTEKLRSIINRFQAQGKTIKALYPTVFAVAAFLGRGTVEDSQMGIFGTANKRIAFIAKKGALQFIRNYESSKEDFSDLDIQNIDMTLRYCDQNFQIAPTSAMILGGLTRINTALTMPDVALASLVNDGHVSCTEEEFNDFFLPITALFAPKSADISVAEFKTLFMVGSFMVTASKVFILATVLSLSMTAYLTANVFDQNKQIKASATNPQDVKKASEELASRRENLEKANKIVQFLNAPSSDLQTLFMDLTDIHFGEFSINNIDAQAEDGITFRLKLRGAAPFDSYAGIKSSFDTLIASIKKMKDITIESKNLNVEDNTFIIEMRYK